MEKQTGQMYEFKFNRNSFEFRDINAAFYTFLGTRLYTTFSGILTEYSQSCLQKAIEEKFGEAFELNVYSTEGSAVHMACRINCREGSENIEIKMIEVDRLFDWYGDQLFREKETTALLSQYEDTYYSYDRKENKISCYRFDVGKEMLGEYSPDEFLEEIISRVSENISDTAAKFISELKNGVRSIEYIFNDPDVEKTLHITGTAIYNDDVHVLTVGRLGDPMRTSSREFVRRDQLTGLFLKENITNYAKRRINELKLPTAVAIIDIDDFKAVNDSFGHTKGDEVLKKCAAIIEAQSEGFGKAGRIGGDEFFVVFDRFESKENLRNVLRAIKNSISRVYNEQNEDLKVTTSIGLSVYPEDADSDYDTLFKLADCLLYRAKSKGKNRYILYDREKHGDALEIVQGGMKNTSLLGSRGMEKSEVVCKITSLILEGSYYPLESLLKDIITYFEAERITVYNKTDREVTAQCGKMELSEKKLAETMDYIYDEGLASYYENGAMMVSNVKRFEEKAPAVFAKLKEQGVFSIIHREIASKSGKTYIISYEGVTNTITWNKEDMHYYRIFDMVFGKCL